MKNALLSLALLSSGLVSAQALDSDYTKSWQDPEVEQRIEAGIRMHRMGYGRLQFVDAKGAAVEDVSVEVEQTRHDFLFGCNIFMLGQYSTAEKNRRYEEMFAKLFNFAYLPFYWSDLEPEQGKLRFAKDSAPIYRRPPPDLCLEYCRQHDIIPKGHILIWHEYLPKWLPNDRLGFKELMIKRFSEIAARYGKEIKYWDVVDETLHRWPKVVLPRDYVFTALQEAARAFPATTSLQIGESAHVFRDFHYETSPFYLLLDNLRLRDARFDALALQFLLGTYQYGPDANGNELSGHHFRPLDMYRVLDQYADFNRPIFISQVAFPSGEPQSEEDQAIVTKNFYRLWFSHPSVESISWWNLPDGTAIPRENASQPGLLHDDLSPKAAFMALDELINKEWRTNIHENSAPAQFKFHGFYGNYRITAKHGGKTVQQDIHLTKDGINDFKIQLP